MKTSTWKITGVLAITALTLAAGCSHDKENPEDKEFFPAKSGQRLDQTMDTQIAAGARHDATLYDANFDGTTLNSLGLQKLAAMMTLSREGKQTIFVDLDEKDDLTKPRLAAVGKFFEDHGMKADQVAVAVGTNPRTLHVASLTSFYKPTDLGLTETPPPEIATPTKDAGK